MEKPRSKAEIKDMLLNKPREFVEFGLEQTEVDIAAIADDLRSIVDTVRERGADSGNADRLRMLQQRADKLGHEIGGIATYFQNNLKDFN